METWIRWDRLEEIGQAGESLLSPEMFRFLEEAMLHVGRKASILERIQIHFPHRGDLPWCAGGVMHAPMNHLFKNSLFTSLPFIPTGGKGSSPLRSFLSSVGEAMERVIPIYVGMRLLGEPTELWAQGTAESLEHAGQRVLGPTDLPLFHERQYQSPDFPFVPFERTQRLTWVRGYDFLTGESVWGPAQVVVMGFQSMDEPRIGYASSAGLAVGPTWEDAFVHGYLEFIERDANNLLWVCQVPPLRLNLTLTDAFRLLSLPQPDLPSSMRFEVFVWPAGVRGVCVVTTHLIHEGFRLYRYFPGIGVGFDLITALRGALGESAQALLFITVMHDFYRTFGRHPNFYFVSKDEDPRKIDNLFKTVFYYGYPENLDKIYHQFFCRCRVIEPYDLSEFGIEIELSICNQIELIKEISYENGLHPVWFDLTPSEISDSLRILKVIIPQLTPYYTIRYPLFGHPRYRYGLKILMGSSDLIDFDQFNFMPLPYP